jgi:hypothetical protein
MIGVKGMTPEIVGDILIWTLPFMTTGITVVLAMSGLYLNRKYQNSKLTQALLILDQVVIDVVKELNQTVVEELKAARADGKLTRDEAEQIKHKAIEVTLKRLNVDMVKTIQVSMGPITDLLAMKIEAAIFDHKKAQIAYNRSGKIQPKLTKIQVSR